MEILSRHCQKFEVIGISKEAKYAAIKHKDKPIYALQFHPEVSHTKFGKKILYNCNKNV